MRLANVGNFQNVLIFRILGVFWSSFLHTTTLKWSYNRFFHLLSIFNFWPKLTILHELQHIHFGNFHNALIYRILGVFLECFLQHKNSNVVAQSFFAPFYHFEFLTETYHFTWALAHGSWPIFSHSQNALNFRILGLFEAGFCTQ